MEASSDVELRIGEVHRVSLGGSGSTGHTWQIDVDGPPGVVVAQLSSTEVPSSKSQSPVRENDSVTHTFSIEAKSTGKAEVRFVLRRPWEKNVAPLRVISIHVTVVP